MTNSAHKAVAIVGVGALMPDAPDARAFWQNIKDGRYSISETPADRWNADLYYDADPKAPDKSYSKIGGWVREWEWDPLQWKLPIPPKVSDVMDLTQKWGIVTAREALADYGYPKRKLDPERTAVILGNAMGGDNHLMTAVRILFPEYAEELDQSPSFKELPEKVRAQIISEMRAGVGRRFPEITEDTMPGELSNIIAGRIASLYNFRGPNYVADAACASAMAAISAAIEGLEENEYDAVITGGVDANMSAQTFVKFCKIGALSATGTRPYAEGADGFVMGEGAAIFIVKRLEDAERDGDRVYAVIRSLGGSSDGKGKGITAPNPIGQRLAVERAWQIAGLRPSAGDLVEGHGTSTRVGDVVEVESLSHVFGSYGVPPQSVALGSVKSNIGHLKGAAGAAGLLKATFALHEKMLPPSANFEKPNAGVDFEQSPFRVNTELREWEPNAEGVRRAGVSAFGFGGTNFHAVLEEYVPGRIERERKTMYGMAQSAGSGTASVGMSGAAASAGRAPSVKSPLRGALVVGAESDGGLRTRLEQIAAEAEAGRAPEIAPPLESDLRAPVRVAIDYGDAAELADKLKKVIAALEKNETGRWKMLRAKGIFIGRGPAPKVAFLFTGQGSQYVNMLDDLRTVEPIIADTYAEADQVMAPILGKPLTDYIFVDGSNDELVEAAAHELKQTVITQPAVLATETALTRLLEAYGIAPDMVMGHSLGEYGALVASGALPFDDGLRAVSARGGEMTKASKGDNGLMAAVHGPIDDIERIIGDVDGYVVVANKNSTKESVIGGATKAVEKAMDALREAGMSVTPLPVSHAFHTQIVGAAADALVGILDKMGIEPPSVPVVANITGNFYPMHPGVEPEMIDILARQVASPVEFVKGLNTLYDAGARVFVELGPKRALYGFATDVVGKREDVVTMFTNHPRVGGLVSFNHALCGLYAAGLGVGLSAHAAAAAETEMSIDAGAAMPAPATDQPVAGPTAVTAPTPPATGPAAASVPPDTSISGDRYVQLGRMFAEFLERGYEVYKGAPLSPREATVCVTGASLGLPGGERVFDDTNVERILRGDTFIDAIPMKLRRAMSDKGITRLVKGKDGEARFETIDHLADVIKLAARAGQLDLREEFGFPEDRLAALDHVTKLAIAAGVDALRDAGIPLVMSYKTTTKGTKLPERWMLPEVMRSDTGVIFGSAFPGYDSLAECITRYEQDRARRQRLADLESLRERTVQMGGGGNGMLEEIDRRIDEIRAQVEREPHQFNRRFLFRVLAMGHSQFAEYVGAQGPNTQINAACATGTQAMSLAQDWIRAGRCRRVVVITADDITTENLMEWFGSGFLASGAAATDETVEEAALPFDRRRHGLVIGMGGAAVVLEGEDAARERGIQPICEFLGAETANSAFHGTRLNVEHICDVMERLVSDAEQRWGIDRRAMARETVFVSHETYTPARGGSASAEVFALRRVFGESADEIVVANTKGFTGHPMGVAIEDVVAFKILETGIVPPVPNHREVDPELGRLNLSKGGTYPVRYALRLAAGFGSQISMTLSRWVPTADGRRRRPNELGFAYRIADPEAWKSWLSRVTGADAPELEIVRRTLRVTDNGHAAQRLEAATSVPADTMPPPRPATSVSVDARAASEAVAPGTAVPDTPATTAPLNGEPSSTSTDVPAAPAPAATVPPTAGVADPVQETVLGIVAEKTGYPPDMLDLDLDLEADLGIDTVKQAETFAAIREAYDIPRDDNLKLRDYATLARAIDFVYEKRPDLQRPAAGAPAAGATPAVTPAATPTPAGTASVTTGAPLSATETPAPRSTAVGAATTDAVQAAVLGIVSEQTGYPPDMLDLDLDLEADLGIDTVKQAEMFAAIRGAYDIPRDDNLKLRDYPTLARAIEFVYEKRPDLKGQGAPPSSVAAPDAAPASAEPATPAPSATTSPPVGAAGAASTTALARATAAADDAVRDTVVAIVSEQTGYPADMLDLDLDLEADLGIDTVKQAEMFAAIRGAYDIPRDDNLKLRDYPTLARAIEFVYEKRPDLKAGAALAADAAPIEAPVGEGPTDAIGTAASEIAQAATEHATGGVHVPRRVPVAQLRPDLELCKPTGVELAEGDRVIVMMDRGGVGRALTTRLEKRGVKVLRLSGSPTAEDLLARIDKWRSAGPVRGLYWLAALDDEGPIGEMDVAAWREANRVRVKLLYHTARALYDSIGERGTFLVSATRLGGRHGYDQAGAASPLGGAVTGFTKSFKREKPGALVKALDLEVTRKTAPLAERLIAETLRDPGVVEVGYQGGHRWTIGFEERTVAESETGIELTKESVFVITGAAGSIVAAITADLATASGGTFHLLDLAPEPGADDPDIERFTADPDGLKRDIFARLKAAGERATPAMVDRELANIERLHAAREAIEAVERAGGTAYYYSVNLLDTKAVAGVMKDINTRSGRVDVLVHAAGLEVSRSLPNKEPAEFERVFDVKSDGWFNIVSELGSMPLGAAVVFSSIAGRFGNAGQTDYSAGNDLLCKLVSNLKATRPDTRGVAIDWTAWGGIGMATRGSIPAIMEQAGIDMLPPDIGIPIVRRELTTGRGGEVIVGGRLGIMMEEFDPSGGLDVEADSEVVASLKSRGVMVERVVGMMLHGGLTIETSLDPGEQPFLYDHQIDDTPVLPGVMGIEALVETAGLVFPGWRVGAVENVDFLSPFKFYRGAPRTVTVRATFAAVDGAIMANCCLVGTRALHGRSEPEVTTHFTARVRLVEKAPRAGKRDAIAEPAGAERVDAGDIYRLYFHGPAYQVVENSWRSGAQVVGAFKKNLPDNHAPAERPTVAAPRLIELCFQTAGLSEMTGKAVMGLPHHIDRVEFVRAPREERGRYYAAVTSDPDGTYDAEVVDADGNVYLTMRGYRTMPLPNPIEDDLLHPLKEKMSRQP